MTPTNLLTLFAAVANFILGLLVLLRNPRKLMNIAFGFFALITSLWCLSNFIFYLQPNFLIFKSQYALGSAAVVAIVIWIRLFMRKVNVIEFTILFALLALFLITPFIGNLFLKSLTINSNHTFNFVTGPFFDYYGIILNLVFVYYIFTVFRGFYKARRLERKQFGYILVGSLGFGLISLVFSFVLPLLSIKLVAPIDAQSSLILVACTAYTIVRHRLMDIRLVVARSVAYIILLATLAAFYAGSVLGLERIFFPNNAAQFNLAEGAMRTVIAVAMVFLFQPLKVWITNATDSIFFKNRYEPQQLLDELSHTIGSTIVLIEMLYRVNDLLIKEMKLSRSAFVLFKNEDEEYTSQAIGYKGWPPIDVPEFVKMVKKGPLIYDELEENSVYKRLLRKHDAAIIVPIKAENELIGVYLAGEKSSGDMFSQQDIMIFEILAPEIAIAIENAKSYEEISKFNVTLRQEVKRATRHLKEKNEQLRELDNAKDEFISMASHQLRTPLTAIKGYLSMLLEGDAGEIKVSQYDFINEAYSAAGRMVGLINDLLNVSRMETGRFFLEPKEVDLERIIDEEVKQLGNHAREKGLSLKIEIKGKVPHIYADETKIRQVVMNFIDNAVYYTQTGGVTVKLHKDKEDVIFEVVDTGIGVPKEQQSHLFEKFFRADNARQSRPDGTGLGIYLARRVTEDHGGKVIFHSEEGKGSTFGFKFPIKARIPAKSTLVPNGMTSGHPSAPSLTSASTMLSTSPDKSTETVTPAPVATHPEG